MNATDELYDWLHVPFFGGGAAKCYQHSYIILHSHQECMGDPVSSHFHQYLVNSIATIFFFFLFFFFGQSERGVVTLPCVFIS